MNKINHLLERLNISEAFIAGQIPTDMVSFCNEYPEKVSGIGLIGATEIDSSTFQAQVARTIIISSDRGITHSAVLNFQNEIPEVATLKF